jgi:hypothetical protein
MCILCVEVIFKENYTGCSNFVDSQEKYNIYMLHNDIDYITYIQTS